MTITLTPSGADTRPVSCRLPATHGDETAPGGQLRQNASRGAYGAHSPERLGWRAVTVSQILARAIAADHARIAANAGEGNR